MNLGPGHSWPFSRNEDTVGGRYLVLVTTKVSHGEFKRLHSDQMTPSYLHHTSKWLIVHSIGSDLDSERIGGYGTFS